MVRTLSIPNAVFRYVHDWYCESIWIRVKNPAKVLVVDPKRIKALVQIIPSIS